MYLPEQFALQTILANNLLKTSNMNLAKELAVRRPPLSEKQLWCVKNYINMVVPGSYVIDAFPGSNTTNVVAHNGNLTPINNSKDPVIPNADKLGALFVTAKSHLKYPHVYIPLDLSQPITQQSDVIKIAIDRKTSDVFKLKVRHNGFNLQIGWLINGVLQLERWRYEYNFKYNWAKPWGTNPATMTNVIFENMIENALSTLCGDPVHYTSKWGKLLSRCCYCFLPLSTPESLAAGYGPDCASHYGLPWGKNNQLSGQQILSGIHP